MIPYKGTQAWKISLYLVESEHNGLEIIIYSAIIEKYKYLITEYITVLLILKHIDQLPVL